MTPKDVLRLFAKPSRLIVRLWRIHCPGYTKFDISAAAENAEKKF
jgi:hypothetical protein